MRSAIRSLNKAHYSNETQFYTTASLRPIEEELLASLSQRSKILDVGCGPGRVSSRLARAGHQVSGIDLVPECINEAHLSNPELDLDLRIGDMCALPFDDNVFDEVWCLRFSFNALPSIEERLQALREMRRVCSPTGRLLVESFNYRYPGRFGLMWLANATEEVSRTLKKLAGSPSPRLNKGDLIYLASKAEHAAPGFAHIPTPRELNDLCNKSGLTNFDIVSPTRVLSRNLQSNLYAISYSLWVRCF